MDEKAKKSRKFNIVDILAVILILAVVAYGAGKLMKRNSPSSGGQPERMKITYVYRVEGVARELYETCKENLPSPLMAGGALLGGQIESVEMEPFMVLSANGEWVEDPDHVVLYFTATATTPKTSVLVTKVGDQEVRIGKKDYILKSEHVELSGGTIIDVKWEE